MFYENALDRDAGLAGVGETSNDAAFSRVSDVGIAVHDNSGIASEFENDFLFPGAALDVPPYGNTPCEADELQAVISDQETGIFIGERQDIEAAVWPSCLLHAFGEKQRAERRLGRGGWCLMWRKT